MEGVNELPGQGVPLLGEEGWLRHQEDAAKPPYEGADGVVSPGQRYNVDIYHNDHPVCAASEASRLFLTGAATPPVPGGEHPVLAIHSHLHRPPLQCSLPSRSPPTAAAAAGPVEFPDGMALRVPARPHILVWEPPSASDQTSRQCVQGAQRGARADPSATAHATHWETAP